jgi:hypothetical protein
MLDSVFWWTSDKITSWCTRFVLFAKSVDACDAIRAQSSLRSLTLFSIDLGTLADSSLLSRLKTVIVSLMLSRVCCLALSDSCTVYKTQNKVVHQWAFINYFLNTGMLTLFPCFSASFFLNKMPVNHTRLPWG